MIGYGCLAATLAGAAAIAAMPSAHDPPNAAPSSTAVQADPPGPLRGLALEGPTRLSLLIANAPPIVYDVDRNRMSPIRGIRVRDAAVVSVLRVGRDATTKLYSGGGHSPKHRSTSFAAEQSARNHSQRHGKLQQRVTAARSG